ncbi:MAG TPA: ester cyclase family protein [Ktedonobacteraceae bacterium]|nr:ester cyclase family protein [Ktedonobacteraceae bacterium]
MVTKQQEQQANIALYRRFLDAMNTADLKQIDNVIAPTFYDHHAGFDINNLEAYKAALQMAHDALLLQGELEDIIATDDKVVTRVKLTGQHVSSFMGIPPTGKNVSWTTIEIWRAANGMLVERWAQDDLFGLMKQLSSDADNVRLVRSLVDIVNGRKYDEMDPLFADTFVDRNPAWNVKGLDELKKIIAAAHQSLDQYIKQDQVYAADGNRVVVHITFTGRHIGTFMGLAPTGKPVTWTSIEVYHIENNKVVERWVQADTAGLMRQLGAQVP